MTTIRDNVYDAAIEDVKNSYSSRVLYFLERCARTVREAAECAARDIVTT